MPIEMLSDEWLEEIYAVVSKQRLYVAGLHRPVSEIDISAALEDLYYENQILRDVLKQHTTAQLDK